MTPRKSYTLVEAMVVIGAVAALLSLLLPTLSRAREESKRTVCASNEYGIGRAFYLYARAAPEVFPAIGQTNTANPGSFRMFCSEDRTSLPATSGEPPSPTVDLWTVARMNLALPRQFICPSTMDEPDPATDTTVYYDFLGINNLSYGYQWQHANSPGRQVIGVGSEPIFPILADANPYIKGGIVTGSLMTDRTGYGAGNSLNHVDREGQNILFQDGHVDFEKGPDAGLPGKVAIGVRNPRGRDDIYAYWRSVTDAVDPGTDKPTWTPGGAGFIGLGGKSDACLIP